VKLLKKHFPLSLWEREGVRGGCIVFVVVCLLTGAPVFAEPQWQMHRTLLDSPMLDAAFPDENTVLVANQNGLVTLNTDAEVLKRQGIDSTVSYPILAENSSYAVVHHRRRVPQFSESVTLYSVSGETGTTFQISGSPYLAPNGDWLLTVDKYNNRVSIYNAQGQKLREDTYPEIRDYGMKFSADGRHVALNLPQNGVDAIAVVYDSIGRLQTKVHHVLGQAQPGLTPNGDTLVLIARAAVTIYDETGTEKQRILRGRNAGVGMLTRDGKRVVSLEANAVCVEGIDGQGRSIVCILENREAKRIIESNDGYLVIVQSEMENDTAQSWSVRVIDCDSSVVVCSGKVDTDYLNAYFYNNRMIIGSTELEMWCRN